MDDSVKRYRERRDARIKERRARVDDQWITMRGTHVLIDDGGQVSKGPENLKNVVKQGGGYKSKAERKYGSTDKFNKALNGGWTKNTAGEQSRPTGKKTTQKDIKDAIRKFMESDDRKGEAGVPMEKYEKLRKSLGAGQEEFKKAWNWVQHERREKLDPEEERTWHPEYYTKSGDDSPVVKGGDPNQHYIYGSEKSRNSATGGTVRQNEEYESIPFSVRFAGRKHADPADVKKARETVSRFIKNAQVGDVYQVGGGFGSAGGQKFKVVTSRGKPALAWQDGDGYYKRPVQMSRANVEDFISNGAKLVKNEK